MELIKVDLGCGKTKTEGWIGIDIRDFDRVDYVLDVSKDKLPFKDDSIDEIRAIHLFEHLEPDGLFHVIDECFRVLKPMGFLHIEVPRAMTPAYFNHPDHRIQFMPDTFGFFQVPSGKDPHGYLKGFWHVTVLKEGQEDHIHVNMYPNKEGGKYPYVVV